MSMRDLKHPWKLSVWVHVGRFTERPTSATINLPIFMVRIGGRFEGVPMRPRGDPSGGIVRKSS